MKPIITAAAVAAALTIPQAMHAQTAERVNPFTVSYTTPYEIPPFDQITYDDYLPALRRGIVEQRSEIQAIASNPTTPTFDNTILAMEKSGELVDKVMLVFASLDETDNTPEMQKISEVAYPMYSEASDEISMNAKLFGRIKYLYEHRNDLGLDKARIRAIEAAYKNFTRNGALLDEAGDPRWNPDSYRPRDPDEELKLAKRLEGIARERDLDSLEQLDRLTATIRATIGPRGGMRP